MGGRRFIPSHPAAPSSLGNLLSGGSGEQKEAGSPVSTLLQWLRSGGREGSRWRDDFTASADPALRPWERETGAGVAPQGNRTGYTGRKSGCLHPEPCRGTEGPARWLTSLVPFRHPHIQPRANAVGSNRSFPPLLDLSAPQPSPHSAGVLPLLSSL